MLSFSLSFAFLFCAFIAMSSISRDAITIIQIPFAVKLIPLVIVIIVLTVTVAQKDVLYIKPVVQYTFPRLCGKPFLVGDVAIYRYSSVQNDGLSVRRFIENFEPPHITT